MPKALILTVGGTPQPVILSIKKNKPDLVIFVASDQTLTKISQIVEESSISNFKTKITPDANSLIECFKTSETACQLAVNSGYKGADIIVDLTGGTKNMSAAVVLASVEFGVSYSYIGTEGERTKNNTGIVQDGQEKLILTESPWDLLAGYEKNKIKDLFNSRQYLAAYQRCLDLSKKTIRSKSLYTKLADLLHIYYYWNRYDYKSASRILTDSLIEAISDLAESFNEGDIHKFAVNSKEKLILLRKIIGQSGKNFDRLCNDMTVDILASAKRYIDEGLYDDAILRIYRSIELWVQTTLYNDHKINTSEVTPEQIPESLISNFRKYKKDSKYTLPFLASITLLKGLGNAMATKLLEEHEDDLRGVMQARNHCTLEHSMNTVKKETAEKFVAKVAEMLNISEKQLDTFPRF